MPLGAIAPAGGPGPGGPATIFTRPSLDGETGRKIVAFVKEQILTAERCIVIVTHDSRIFEYSNRIMGMEDGRITGFEAGGGT